MAEEIEQPFLSGTASALGQLPDQVWEEVRHAIKLSNQTEAFWDHLLAFVHAVDWTVRPGLWPAPQQQSATCAHSYPMAGCTHMQETWIRGILAGHVAIFLLVLLCRRNTAVLTGVFMLLGGCAPVTASLTVAAWQRLHAERYTELATKGPGALTPDQAHGLANSPAALSARAPTDRELGVLWREHQQRSRAALAGVCKAGLL